MRFLVFLAIFAFALAPAFAKPLPKPPDSPIVPAADPPVPDAPLPEADAVPVPPPPPANWQDIMEMESVTAVFVPIDAAKIDLSSPKTTGVSVVMDERKPITVEYRYTPLHTQPESAVPEPGGIAVLGAGAAGLALKIHRLRSAHKH